MQGYLTGPEVEAIMFEAGYLAQALYESSAPKNTGRLAASSVVDVEIARTLSDGRSTVGGYAISGKLVWCAGVFRPHDKPAGPPSLRVAGNHLEGSLLTGRYAEW